MTFGELLKNSKHEDAPLILSQLLSKDLSYIYSHMDELLSETLSAKFEELYELISKGLPFAYLFGKKAFFDIEIPVNNSVLIPRPETELLISKVLESIDERPLTILDVGTGSGCIAISLALARKNRDIITATDISKNALEVAKANSEHFGVDINFVQSDLLENLKGKFDVVVANLPYVRFSDYKLLIEGLKFEPTKAITDGSEDWRLTKRFFTQIPEIINEKSLIFLEHDPKAVKFLKELGQRYLPDFKFIPLRDYKDLFRYFLYFPNKI